MPVLQEQKPAWEARFKCQTLLDDNAVLSAIAYDAHGCASAASAGCARAAVDLNPVRAKICDSLEDSAHTSARTRLEAIEKDQRQADQPLAPVLGLRGFGVLMLQLRDYLELVDHTGRQIRRAWMR